MLVIDSDVANRQRFDFVVFSVLAEQFEECMLAPVHYDARHERPMARAVTRAIRGKQRRPTGTPRMPTTFPTLHVFI